MLPRDRAEQILTMHAAGWSMRAIAVALGHSQQTIRGYIHGQRAPGTRAPRQERFADIFIGYCRQRFVEDPYLKSHVLLEELIELGYRGSRASFYRALSRHHLLPPGRRRSQPADAPPATPQPVAVPTAVFLTAQKSVVLPRRIAPITGETLLSFLTRVAHANHLSLTEVLAVLPSWFSTKVNNADDRAQHHMLAPAAADGLRALAHLASTTTTSLARALPAFATTDAPGPIRATTACHRCAARHGINQPVPVHLPAHQKICTRHQIWLGDPDQPHLDLTSCPEITAAQHRANRLLRRHTPQQLMLAFQTASKSIPEWPDSPAAIQTHWKYRLLALQTANRRRGTPTDLDAHNHAAIYPDAITGAAQLLNRSQPAIGGQI